MNDLIENKQKIKCDCDKEVVSGIAILLYPDGANKRFLERWDVVSEGESGNKTTMEKGKDFNLTPHRCGFWKGPETFHPVAMIMRINPEVGN